MSGFEVVGVILAVPSLIQLVKHIYVAVQEGKAVPKEVEMRIARIHAELEKMKLLMDKNQSYQEEQAVQATLRDLHHELKGICDECNKKYGRKTKSSIFNAIKPLFQKNGFLAQLERLEVNLSYAYQNWITELLIRTESRVISLDGKIETANKKNIEDGMVEVNMNFHRILEELNRMQHSSAPIAQEQETFSMSETSPDWQYFRSKFSSLLSVLEGKLPIAPYHERPLPDEGIGLNFDKRIVSIDDAIRTSLNLLHDIRGAGLSDKGLEPTLLLSTLRNLSRYLIYLHRYQECLELHRRIIPLLSRLDTLTGNKLTSDLVSFLGSMALLLGLSGSFGEARDICREAVRWAETLSAKEPHPLLGLVLRITSAFEPELQKGVELRLKAVSAYRSLAAIDPIYSNYLAATLSSLGRALLLVQRYDSALQSLKEATRIFENLERPANDQFAVCLTRLAQAYKARGQEKECEEVIERATNLIGSQTEFITFSSASWKPQILSEINRVRDGEIVPSSLRFKGMALSDQLTLQELQLSPPEKRPLPPNNLATIEEAPLQRLAFTLTELPPIPMIDVTGAVEVYPRDHMLAGKPINPVEQFDPLNLAELYPLDSTLAANPYTESGVEANITVQIDQRTSNSAVVHPTMGTPGTWLTERQAPAPAKSAAKRLLPETQAQPAAAEVGSRSRDRLTENADSGGALQYGVKVAWAAERQKVPRDGSNGELVVEPRSAVPPTSVMDRMGELDGPLSEGSKDSNLHVIELALPPGQVTGLLSARSVVDMMSGDSEDAALDGYRQPRGPRVIGNDDVANWVRGRAPWVEAEEGV